MEYLMGMHFGKFDVDKAYIKYCKTTFGNMSEKGEVEQEFADKELGETLLQKMIKKIRGESIQEVI